jgi:hypothetical protein
MSIKECILWLTHLNQSCLCDDVRRDGDGAVAGGAGGGAGRGGGGDAPRHLRLRHSHAGAAASRNFRGRHQEPRLPWFHADDDDEEEDDDEEDDGQCSIIFLLDTISHHP